MKPWKILSSRQVMQDQYLGLRTDRCERADGHIIETYHVIEVRDWVTLVPLTEAGNVLLVREYRHAAQVMLNGLPGGYADPGETDWAAAAARELAEETGHVPREMHWIGTCHPNAATQTNCIHYYLALGCTPQVAQNFDANEDIELFEMPYAEFLDYGTQEVQHALHAAALFYAERHFLKHPHLRPQE